MKSRLVSVALLAAALAFAVPSGALAQGRGHGGDHGNRGGDHGNRGGGGGDRGNRGNGGDHGRGGGGGGGDRGGWRAGGGDHGGGNAGGGDRGGWRAGGGGGDRGGDRGTWNGGGDRGGTRTWNGGRDRGAWNGGATTRYRGDVRYRGGNTVYAPRITTTRTRYYSGYTAPRYFGGYRFSGGYRYGGYSYPRYFYYNSFYPRPRFYHSGFSIGFVIASYPGAGYRYYDPYCDRYFNYLGSYDDHCWEFGHPPVVEVLRYGRPVASAVFDDGEWVVDDCD